MISLLFKFFGDSKPLVEETRKAKKEMSGAGVDIGKEFGSQFKGAVMGFIGAGAIVGAFRSAMTDAQKVRMDALRTGMSEQRVQLLDSAAEKLGISSEQLSESVKAMGEQGEKLLQAVAKTSQFMSNNAIKNFSELDAQLSTLKLNFIDLLAPFAKLANIIIGGSKAFALIAGGTLAQGVAKSPFGALLGQKTRDRLYGAGLMAHDAATDIDFVMPGEAAMKASGDLGSAFYGRAQRIATGVKNLSIDEGIARAIVEGKLDPVNQQPFWSKEQAQEFIERLDAIKMAIEKS